MLLFHLAIIRADKADLFPTRKVFLEAKKATAILKRGKRGFWFFTSEGEEERELGYPERRNEQQRRENNRER